MRLAVFTSGYPARIATFFERDMRALLDAGIEIDIFPIRPLEPSLWDNARLVETGRLSRDRVHHLPPSTALGRAIPMLRRAPARSLRDAGAAILGALRYGPMPTVKTAYVFPQAWAWAAEHGDRYDHVLAYWGNYAGTCAYAYHRLLRRRVPFSIWLHAGTDLYRTPVFMRRKLAYADNVITCCEFNRGYIEQRFPDLAPMVAAKLHVIHHGLDLAELPYQPGGRPGNRIIAVGRLGERKGFDDLVRAVQTLTARGVDVECELVGDGPERNALKALAAKLGIVDRVQFRGWMPFTKARDAMSTATILVHPSPGLGDGLPNVIREAMALGTPVVASNVAGIPDALSDGCGVLVPPREPVALATAIGALLDQPDARAAIAARARRRVEERYDTRTNGVRLAELLSGSVRRGDRIARAAWTQTRIQETV